MQLSNLADVYNDTEGLNDNWTRIFEFWKFLKQPKKYYVSNYQKVLTSLEYSAFC